MRVARRTFIASTLMTAAAPAVLRLARADAPQVVLKLHHSFSSVSGAHDKFVVPWAKQVQAQSGDRIRIDLFPSMQLGGAPAALFDQARDGVADIVWAMPSLTPGRFPRIEAWELPFVPSRRALVSSKAIDDFGRANLMDEFREVHPICFSCSGRGVLHANRPIRTVEDMKDSRLQVQTRFAGDAVRMFGAVPVLMPSGQLPLAITQHVVDGCIDPWDMMPALKLNDLLRTHTEFSDTSPSSTTFALVMNKAAYDRLPRELKSVIDANSGLVAAGLTGTMWDLQAAAVVDTVAQRGDPITTLQPEAVAHWRTAVQPVIDGWIKGIKDQKADGGKLLASARASLAKFVNEPEPQPAHMQPSEPASEPSSQSQSTQPAKPAAEAKADANGMPKPEAPADVSSKPMASAPSTAKPEANISVAPQASAPDKPQSWSSWLRSWFSSRPTASSAPVPSGVAHGPASVTQVPSATAAVNPAPVTTPSAAAAPVASPPVATPAPAAAPAINPVPVAPAPAVTPAPIVAAPAASPAPIPAPITPLAKPAAKALDLPL